jgi:hypothetical protein
LRRVDKLHAGRNFETAGAADDEIALHARFLDRLDQELRIAGGEVDRADHGVVTLEQLDETGLVEDIALFAVTPGSLARLS